MLPVLAAAALIACALAGIAGTVGIELALFAVAGILLGVAATMMRPHAEAGAPAATGIDDTLPALVAAAAGAPVILAETSGRILGTAGGVAPAAGMLADHVNVADRPQLLLALSRAAEVPQETSLRMRMVPAAAFTEVRLSIVARGEGRLIVVRDAPALAERTPFVEMAHDMRAQLGAIINLADALTDPAISDAVKQSVYPRLIAGAGRDLLAMSNAMLDGTAGVARRGAGEIVQQFCATMASTASARGVTLYNRLPAEMAAEPVDAVPFARLVSNIVGNAIKHGTPGTSVEINARRKAGVWTLSVKDNGPGMDVDALARAGAGGASGHGMSIINRLAETAGGTVSIESQPGKGTHLMVSFRTSAAIHPISAAEAPQTQDCEGADHAPFRRTA